MSKKLEDRLLRQPANYRWNPVMGYWETEIIDIQSGRRFWFQSILNWGAQSPDKWGIIEEIYRRNPGYYAVRLPDYDPTAEGVSS